jgi:membrane protein DedA with SNARE-associated domain
MGQWIISFIEQYGYPAILFLMLIENVFPPIPSELIMPFAGYVAAQGKLHPALVVLAGTAGSIVGTLPWYLAGRAVGQQRLRRWADRHGRWLAIKPEEVETASRWFARRGALAVAIGRLVPAVRSVMSAPAGVARMAFVKFLFWSALGSLLWTGGLTAVGYALAANYDQAARWLEPLTRAVLGLALVGYLWRVAKFRRSGRA